MALQGSNEKLGDFAKKFETCPKKEIFQILREISLYLNRILISRCEAN
jgi:hypothetical protein